MTPERAPNPNPVRTYLIDTRQGFGWRLYLYADGVEVGGGVYDLDEYGEALADAEEFTRGPL